MSRLLLVLVFALASGACGAAGGGGGKAVLSSRCVEDGNDKKACDCMATETENALDPEVFEAMVLAAQGKDDEADAAMQKLTQEQQFSVVKMTGDTLEKCGFL
ncbi:MAG: hypothetical protein SGJ21_03705 [Alphaproteobacteria bacterium]|nr:hypothetical protein [Alphaproteobacteria bacterium]